MFGGELRGFSLGEVVGSLAETVRTEYDGVRDTRAPHYVSRMVPWEQMSHRRYHRLLLPLASDDGGVDTLLGVIVFDETAVDSPPCAA